MLIFLFRRTPPTFVVIVLFFFALRTLTFLLYPTDCTPIGKYAISSILILICSFFLQYYSASLRSRENPSFLTFLFALCMFSVLLRQDFAIYPLLSLSLCSIALAILIQQDDKNLFLHFFNYSIIMGIAALIYLPILLFYFFPLLFSIRSISSFETKGVISSLIGLFIPFVLLIAFNFIYSATYIGLNKIPSWEEAIPLLNRAEPSLSLPYWITYIAIFSLLVFWALFQNMKLNRISARIKRGKNMFSLLFFSSILLTYIFQSVAPQSITLWTIPAAFSLGIWFDSTQFKLSMKLVLFFFLTTHVTWLFIAS